MNLSVKLEPNAQAPRFSRARLSEVKDELGSRYEDVTVLVSELVTNSVRHADGNGPVELKIETEDNLIRLEVVDFGPCFDPDSASESDGFGLEILDKLSQRWGVDNGDGCRVWAELALPDSPQNSD